VFGSDFYYCGGCNALCDDDDDDVINRTTSRSISPCEAKDPFVQKKLIRSKQACFCRRATADLLMMIEKLADETGRV
jgi:hypothetical protein